MRSATSAAVKSRRVPEGTIGPDKALESDRRAGREVEDGLEDWDDGALAGGLIDRLGQLRC